MFSHWNKDGYHPSPALKAFQVFLLILIIIGIGLLITKDRWVPKLVNYILEQEGSPVVTTSTEGDQNEHAAQGDHRITAAQTALLGEWQSTEDPNVVQIFKENGEGFDEYRTTEEPTQGSAFSWDLFTGENPLPGLTDPNDGAFQGNIDKDAIYMRRYDRGSGNLYYKLEKVTPEELSMIYLGRGNILGFKKIN
jgi:hypothetical protein